VYYTGYYANMKKMPPNSGYTLVSISQKAPEWFDYDIRLGVIAPTWPMIQLAKNQEYEEFIRLYNIQLSKVSLRQIFEEVPDNSIFLCHELPDVFCHRHLWRAFLQSQGYMCEEIKF